MRYYLDTEFNGYRGDLISLALVREDGRSLYIVLPYIHLEREGRMDPWVADNVITVLQKSPEPPIVVTSRESGAHGVAQFLGSDLDPVIISDWITDIEHLCGLLNEGSKWWSYDGGPMLHIESLKFEVAKVDAYPNNIAAAVQHNAWWDAVCLAEKLGAELGG